MLYLLRTLSRYVNISIQIREKEVQYENQTKFSEEEIEEMSNSLPSSEITIEEISKHF